MVSTPGKRRRLASVTIAVIHMVLRTNAHSAHRAVCVRIAEMSNQAMICRLGNAFEYWSDGRGDDIADCPLPPRRAVRRPGGYRKHGTRRKTEDAARLGRTRNGKPNRALQGSDHASTIGTRNPSWILRYLAAAPSPDVSSKALERPSANTNKRMPRLRTRSQRRRLKADRLPRCRVPPIHHPIWLPGQTHDSLRTNTW